MVESLKDFAKEECLGRVSSFECVCETVVFDGDGNCA